MLSSSQTLKNIAVQGQHQCSTANFVSGSALHGKSNDAKERFGSNSSLIIMGETWGPLLDDVGPPPFFKDHSPFKKLKTVYDIGSTNTVLLLGSSIVCTSMQYVPIYSRLLEMSFQGQIKRRTSWYCPSILLYSTKLPSNLVIPCSTNAFPLNNFQLVQSVLLLLLLGCLTVN